MKPAPFTYHAPTSVAEAVALLSRLSPEEGRVMAGGQTLIPMMAFRLARPKHLIDINRIPEFSKIAIENGMLSIGATVRHNALEQPIPGSGQLGLLLASVARNIAHPPIRSRGTFCGSIANSDPASEWCLATVTLGAEIVLKSERGEKVVPAHRFYTGIMSNELAADELISKVRIPLLPDDSRFGFHEISRRQGDFAMAAALVAYRLLNGRVVDPRIGVGGVEPSPRRIATAEDVLAAATPGVQLFQQVAATSAGAVNPMDDEAMPAEYRRELVQAVVERALERSLT